MKMKKLSNILTIIVVILLIILVFFIKNIYEEIKNSSNKEVKTLDIIENYGYSLTENDTILFKEEFKNLKNILGQEEIDKEKYAESISKLFIIDFYSLESAINKNDVGGVQFIYESSKENFIKKAKDTIYNHIENNIYGKREQELPNVNEVKLSTIKETEVDDFDEAYILELTISYEKDLDYPNSIELTIVNNDGKLEIISIN